MSYCWGAASNNLITTSENLRQRMSSIDWDDIRRLVRDVIQLCWALDIPYLWIDSLCVTQDSQEDWAIESSRMADVYRNATLTVAASSATDPNPSLYSDRWGYDKLRKVVNSRDLDTNGLHARIHYPLAGVTIKHKEEIYLHRSNEIQITRSDSRRYRRGRGN